MRWKRRELRIRGEGGALLRKAFGDAGLLFLGTAPLQPRGGELSLALDASPLPMTHILFLNRRDCVRVIALRPEVLLDQEDSIRQGECFQLGCRRYRVEWGDRPSGSPPRRRRVLLPAAVGVLLFAVAVGWRSWSPSTVGDAPPAPEGRGAPSSDHAEARELMREGRRAEARLALIAAIEGDPEDAEARRLLLSIPDRREEGDPGEMHGADRAATAEELLDQGRELLKRGEPASARQRFGQAGALLAAEAPAAAAEAAYAAEEAEAAIRRQQGPEIERAEAIAAAAAGAPVESAATLLVEARAIAAAVAQQLPEDLPARALLGRIEKQLAVAARRWLSIADTEASLQGCRVAAPTYRKIAAALSQGDPALSALASRRAGSCRP